MGEGRGREGSVGREQFFIPVRQLSLRKLQNLIPLCVADIFAFFSSSAEPRPCARRSLSLTLLLKCRKSADIRKFSNNHLAVDLGTPRHQKTVRVMTVVRTTRDGFARD